MTHAVPSVSPFIRWALIMEDVLFIISFFLILPIVVFTFAYRVRKLKAEERIAQAQTQRFGAVGSEGLRMSELQALIDDAVDEATAPLYDRIEALEGRDPARRDPLTGDFLDDRYLAPNGPVAPKTVGRSRS
ncbi:MAG: hypothetical protein AAFN13_01695 [Bacteroidota bacterium]